MGNSFTVRLVLLGTAAAVAGSAPVQAQVVDNWNVASDTGDNSGSSGSVTAINTAADGILLTGSTGDPGSTVNATIGGGTHNSISASAVGASANVNFGSTSSVDGQTNVMVKGGLTVDAENIGSPVTNMGDIQSATIVDGTSNSISRSAVGASASITGSVVITGGANRSENFTIGGATTVSASNDSDVTLQTDIGNGGSSGLGPRILNGNGNSITASAVGAAASIAFNAYIDDGTADLNYAVGVDPSDPNSSPQAVSVTATNSGNVTVGSTSDVTAASGIYGAEISGTGSRNTIAITAVGATATIGVTTVVHSGQGTPKLLLGDYTLDAINTGSVTNNTMLGSSADDAPKVTSTGHDNSVSSGAIGTTMSFSITYLNADGTENTGSHDTTMGALSFTGTNSGGVSAVGDMASPQLPSGVGRSSAVMATGSAMGLSLGS